MSNFLKEFEQRKWKRDIENFALYKEKYSTTQFDMMRRFCMRRMKEIQMYWPQFIKISEIPD